jgi:MFS family permease
MSGRERPVSATAACWTLFVLLLVNAVNVGDRTLLGVVTEPVKHDLQLSDTEMSLANGFLFVLFNLVGGLLIARFVDRGNRKRILAIGLAGWSIATAATGLAHDFLTLSAARILVGIGEATAFPAAMSLIPDLFSPRGRGKAIGVFQSSTLVGIIGGTILAGVLAASQGWRAMFEMCGAAGVILALVLLVTVKEPPRESEGDDVIQAAWSNDFRHGLRRILAQPGFIALALAFGVSGMMVSVLAVWAPAFLQRSHGVPLAQVGVVIGPAVGIGGIAGMIVSGALADRLAVREGTPLAMLRVPLFALPLSIPFLAGYVAFPSLGLTMLSASVMNFLVSSSYAPCVNYAVSTVGPRDRGLVSAVLLATSGLIGSGLGPFIVGAASDILTPIYGDEGLRYAIGWMIPTPAIAFALLWLAMRQARRTAAPLPA